MDDAALGAVVRSLRQRHGWRQTDLARLAGVSDTLVGLLESGGAERLGVRRVRRVCAALDIRLGWDAGYRRAELAKLRDERHAALGEKLTRELRARGWLVAPEVSFNEFGDRGRMDLLAFEPPSRTLLVVEIKTVVVDVQDLLGGLDVKQRVAGKVARRMGWQSASIVPVIVLAATAANRRRIADHAQLFGGFTLRGHAARHWLRAPRGRPSGVLFFKDLPNPRRVGVKRVRPPRRRAIARALSVGMVPGPPHQRSERG